LGVVNNFMWVKPRMKVSADVGWAVAWSRLGTVIERLHVTH
jgi:hypothetical protein